jgi:hypothetical protein
MRRAVQPVFDAIRAEPDTAKVLQAIGRLRTPAVATPLRCSTTAQPVASGLPVGQYTWTLTAQDGRTRPGGKALLRELPDVARAVITPGHIVISASSKGGPETIEFEEDFSVFKDRINIGGGAITGRWEVDGAGNLHFSDIHPPGGGEQFVFATHPWKRAR